MEVKICINDSFFWIAGAEFCSRESLQFYKSKLISHKIANNATHKASMAELTIKNLRLRLRRHYTHTRKKAWLSIMPALVTAYNTAPKRSLGGLSPAQAVNLTNDHLRRLRRTPAPGPHAKAKYRKNQIVRIINPKKAAKICRKNVSKLEQ